MKFQTQIPLHSAEGRLLDFDTQSVLLGSCFTKHLSNKLEYYKFQTLSHPYGILFHPQALLTLLKHVHQNHADEQAIFFSDEQWKSFDAHSCLNHSSKATFQNQLSLRLNECNTYFKSASHFIITLGTAWCYRHLKTKNYVANCHKQPASLFDKKLFDIDELTDILYEITNLIHGFNSKAEVIFTVSPVRHLKDGFIENSQSKAHLISAVHRVVQTTPLLHYFPSYELMMDELRDYRFYERDMLHPNAQAIDFIWEKFKSIWINPNLLTVLKSISRIQNGLQHKPFNAESAAHQEFRSSLEAEVKRLTKEYPGLNF